MRYVFTCTVLCLVVGHGLTAGAVEPEGVRAFYQAKRASQTGICEAQAATFQVPVLWEYSVPLIAPEKRDRDPSRAQKDPTVVFYGGKWHVFMTVKLPGRSAIEYCSFENWDKADSSRRTILRVSDSNYYCAPQLFFFTPHHKWYVIYQMQYLEVWQNWYW